MPYAWTGLSRRKGKCVGKPRGISRIQPNWSFAECILVLHTHEISLLRAELVFRVVPEELVERGWYAQWFCTGLCLHGPSVNPPRDGVTRVSAAPTDLGLLPSRCLAARLLASVLAAPCAGASGRNHRRQIEHGLFQPRAWRCFMVTIHRCDCGIQLKLPGSVLESTGGSILASAEESYWSVPFPEPGYFFGQILKDYEHEPCLTSPIRNINNCHEPVFG